jgi:transcriptional regulator with XRE-family HTH domain
MQIESEANIASMVREELARRRLSRQWLADESKVSLSTLEKTLAGRRPFTLGTIVRLEDALKISLRNHVEEHELVAGPACAPDEMGGYARPGVRWLEGEYLTLRPSLGEASAIYAYHTSIQWDEANGHLVFSEADRQDAEFSQAGYVSLPALSGHIYLVTISSGQYRLIILGRPAAGGPMCGILATLAAGNGAQLMPAATPITLVPNDKSPEADIGVIRPGDPCYDAYRSRIDHITERGFARFTD